MIRFRSLLRLWLATTLFGIAAVAEWEKYEEAIRVLAEKHGEEIDNSYRTVVTAQADYRIRSLADKFPCKAENLKSLETPTSVHLLMPSDVRVMAALGDSLTAASGAGALTILGMIYDYRGMSWSIGGDNHIDERISYPNVMKVYNPSVTGYSLGVGNENSQAAHLNVAIRGQDARYLLAQTTNLIERMRGDEEVDFEEDWKVITIEIGGNDICDYDPVVHSPDNFIFGVTQSLDLLFNEVPRALVNLVLVIDITPILELGPDWSHWFCDLAHLLVCPYAVSNITAAQEIQLTYNRMLEDLISSGTYDQREDFTVVIQPFLSKLVLDPEQDIDFYRQFFAPDCTHPSDLGHQVMAGFLWNNMIEPVGKKTDSVDLAKLDFQCPPQDHPYFYTRLNSDPSLVKSSSLAGVSGVDGSASGSGVGTGWILTATLLIAIVVPCLIAAVWKLWKLRKDRQGYHQIPTSATCHL